MMKHTILGLVLFVVVASSASAETNIKIDGIKGESRDVPAVNTERVKAVQFREDLKEQREVNVEQREEIKTQADEMKKEVMEKRDEMKLESQEARADATEAGKELQAEFQAEMDAATTDAERTAIKEKYAEKRDELQGESKEKRDELKAERMAKADELKDKRKDFLEERLENILRKYEAYQKRAQSVYERIEFNINKLDDAGVDVSTLEKYQEEGKVLLATVESEMTASRVGIEEILAGSLEKDEIKSNLEKIKENLSGAKKALKDYFAGVREIVKELKANKPVDTEEEGSEDGLEDAE